MIDLKLYREIKVVELTTLLLLWLTACMLTLVFKGFYNQDMGVSIHVVESLEGVGFLDALQTNSIVLYLLRIVGDTLLFQGNYTLLMYWFYLIAQTYIVYSFAKHAGLYYAIVILLIVFFTVILNQMRFGLAISVMLISFEKNSDTESFNWSILILGLLMILLHIFVGIFYFLYITVRKFQSLIYIIGIAIVLGYSSLVFFLEDSRYIFYLEEDAERGSFSSLLFLVIYGIGFSSLDRFHRIFFMFLLVMAGFSYNLASVSSRLSELSIIFLLVVLSKKETTIWTKLLLLGCGISFFSYRAFNWFVMGQVPLSP